MKDVTPYLSPESSSTSLDQDPPNHVPIPQGPATSRAIRSPQKSWHELTGRHLDRLFRTRSDPGADLDADVDADINADKDASADTCRRSSIEVVKSAKQAERAAILDNYAKKLLTSRQAAAFTSMESADSTNSSSYYSKMVTMKHVARTPLFNQRSQKSRQITPDHDEREEVKDRECWLKKVDFGATLLGSSIGYSNINSMRVHMLRGRSAFVIPVLLFWCLLGLPLVIACVSLGQFTSHGPTKCWGFARLFQGVGFVMVLEQIARSTYYNVNTAIFLRYLLDTWKDPLPWESCRDDQWKLIYGNSKRCRDLAELNEMMASSNQSSFSAFKLTPAANYFSEEIVQQHLSEDSDGEVDTNLLLCLAVAWIAVLLAVVPSVRYVGKLVKWTLALTFVLMVAVFIKAVTLPGYKAGLLAFVEPKWSELAKLDTWMTTAIFVFVHASYMGRVGILYASFNKFNYDCVGIVVVVVMVGLAMAHEFLGLVEMAINGAFSDPSNVGIEALVEELYGSASEESSSFRFLQVGRFVVTTSHLLNYFGDYKGMWLALLFLLFACLGFLVQLTTVKAASASLAELFSPDNPWIERYISLGICVLCFGMGVLIVRPSENHNVGNIIVYFSRTMVLPTILLIIALAFVYGTGRFLEDVHCMVGSHVLWGFVPFRVVNVWLWISLKLVMLPVGLFVLTSLIYHSMGWVGTAFSTEAIVFGFLLKIVILMPLFVVPLVVYFRNKQEGWSAMERFKCLLRPTETWGPLRQHDRIASGYNPTPSC